MRTCVLLLLGGRRLRRLLHPLHALALYVLPEQLRHRIQALGDALEEAVHPSQVLLLLHRIERTAISQPFAKHTLSAQVTHKARRDFGKTLHVLCNMQTIERASSACCADVSTSSCKRP